MINNPHIAGAFFKSIGYLDPSKNIVVSVSGGSDSDVIVDFVHQCGYSDKVSYIFFDTGLEYQATKDHLDYLEDRYGIVIERIRSYRSIPTCCKSFGIPFVSKFASECIHRLQQHSFNFEDRPLKELIKDYPTCKSALKWWCNENRINSYNVAYKKHLKEFLVEHPPKFPISSLCCTFAKKTTAKEYYRTHDTDIVITGLRKAEGGVRAGAYDSCYKVDKPDNYRPIWWFTDEDKQEYCRKYGVIHSKAYTKYGFARTGCACCPFGLGLSEELRKTEQYEPKLYNAVRKVFGKSYDYTEQYRVFRLDREHETFRQKRSTPCLECHGVVF